MTTANEGFEQADVRALTGAEIEEIGGGAISLGTYIRRLVWQVQNAPTDSVLVGCSDDMSSCSWQSK